MALWILQNVCIPDMYLKLSIGDDQKSVWAAYGLDNIWTMPVMTR